MCKQLLEKFPLHSISLLNKILQRGVNSIKALKILQENGKISNDSILMIDEMYLEKATQYHSGVHVAADDEGNLYKGIVAFMIVGLKESIPYTAQTTLEVKFSGEWLAKKCQIALMILHQENFVYEVSSLKTTLQIYMHFLQSLQFSILIHINTSITQEILARKRTYIMIRCIS